MKRHGTDSIVRGHVSGLSRREALRRLGGGGIAAMAGARLAGTTAAQDATPAPASDIAPEDAPIDHIIVVFFENHTFDNLYGLFSGADGLAQPDAVIPQTNLDGDVYATLPQVVNTEGPPLGPDHRFPESLPNAPFPISQYVGLDEEVPSSAHRFYQHILQINGGRMDRYIAWSDSGALPMGYYDTTQLPLYPYALEYTLADTFFTGAFGGSMLNHFWLICAATPVWPDAPADIVAQPVFDENDVLIDLTKDGDVTPDDFVVNDVQPIYRPYQAGTPASQRMPPQTMTTIGERLTEAGQAWAWYAGGWNDAMAGNPDSTFVYHHQPFVYFEQYADGTAAKTEHLKDEVDFMAAVADGTLPAVSFVKPLGKYDEHAGYSTILDSERHVVELIEHVKASPVWDRCAIIVTYDDFGGWYDHVAPPEVDRWVRGGGVPALVISPHAKRRFVDHTVYDHTSILKLIEWRYGLEPLTDRDAAANNMLAAFDFGG